MQHCPSCDTKLNATATADSFLQDPEWDFWGEEGKRWIICKEDKYIHFRILNKGYNQHRVAVIR